MLSSYEMFHISSQSERKYADNFSLIINSYLLCRNYLTKYLNDILFYNTFGVTCRLGPKLSFVEKDQLRMERLDVKMVNRYLVKMNLCMHMLQQIIQKMLRKL